MNKKRDHYNGAASGPGPHDQRGWVRVDTDVEGVRVFGVAGLWGAHNMKVVLLEPLGGFSETLTIMVLLRTFTWFADRGSLTEHGLQSARQTLQELYWQARVLADHGDELRAEVRRLRGLRGPPASPIRSAEDVRQFRQELRVMVRAGTISTEQAAGRIGRARAQVHAFRQAEDQLSSQLSQLIMVRHGVEASAELLGRLLKEAAAPKGI